MSDWFGIFLFISLIFMSGFALGVKYGERSEDDME